MDIGEDFLFAFCRLWVFLFAFEGVSAIGVVDGYSRTCLLCFLSFSDRGIVDGIHIVAELNSIGEVLDSSLGTSLLANELGHFP